MQNQQLSYNEFLCFVLIYVSKADAEFKDSEKEDIIEQFGSDTYRHQLRLFESMSDYHAIETILGYKELYYPTPEKKKELLDKIKQQLHTDGNTSRFEQKIFHDLEKLL